MPPDELDRDAAFALLSNRRRRLLLCLLVRHGESLYLSAAAREIAGRGGSDDEAYRSVYVSLYQTHAPRLAAEGIVHYDEDERTIRLVHSQRTAALLEFVGIEPTVRRSGIAVVAVGTVLCAVLALIDRTWLLPWAGLTGWLLLAEVRQFRAHGRIAPVNGCGDLTDPGSPSGIGGVDGDARASERQHHGQSQREVVGDRFEFADEDDDQRGGEKGDGLGAEGVPREPRLRGSVVELVERRQQVHRVRCPLDGSPITVERDGAEVVEFGEVGRL
jgi:hypothetical protein